MPTWIGDNQNNITIWRVLRVHTDIVFNWRWSQLFARIYSLIHGATHKQVLSQHARGVYSVWEVNSWWDQVFEGDEAKIKLNQVFPSLKRHIISKTLNETISFSKPLFSPSHFLGCCHGSASLWLQRKWPGGRSQCSFRKLGRWREETFRIIRVSAQSLEYLRITRVNVTIAQHSNRWQITRVNGRADVLQWTTWVLNHWGHWWCKQSTKTVWTIAASILHRNLV